MSWPGSSTGRRRNLPQKVPAPAELRPCRSPRLPKREVPRSATADHSDDEDASQGMDISCHYFTSPRTSQENPTLDLKSAFSEIQEVHDESTNQGLCLQMDMLSHDTGYQTNSQDTEYGNSLQLNSQDLGFNSHSVGTCDPSLHCNLTNPFSQMPLLTNENELNLELAESKGVANPNEPDVPAEMSFNEDRIIRKARVLLGKPPDATPPGNTEKPKLVQSIGVPYFPWHTETTPMATFSEGDHNMAAGVTGDSSTHVLPSKLC